MSYTTLHVCPLALTTKQMFIKLQLIFTFFPSIFSTIIHHIYIKYLLVPGSSTKRTNRVIILRRIYNLTIPLYPNFCLDPPLDYKPPSFAVSLTTYCNTQHKSNCSVLGINPGLKSHCYSINWVPELLLQRTNIQSPRKMI